MKRSAGGTSGKQQGPSVSDAVLELAKVTGGKPGYCRHALTILPTEDGRYVFVELEKVTFRDCHMPERCILPKPTPEPRAVALRRLIEAARHRTMRMISGWSPEYALRGGR